MTDLKISTELREKSENFLKKLHSDLEEITEIYRKLAEEVEEYLSVQMFLSKELEMEMQNEERTVMTNLGHNIYTKATVNPSDKIIICLKDDLFMQMSYERALNYVKKRLALLNDKGEELAKEMAQIKAHITFVHAAMNPSQILEKIL